MSYPDEKAGAAASAAPDVQVGQRWRDLDRRSNYDTLPDGTYPIPDDYEGPLSMRPRIVVVELIVHDRANGDSALVHNEHNDRISQIKVKSFRRSGDRRGFELLP